MTGAANINFYSDFRGLAQLRANAARDEASSTREASRQFEALFVQMMLKSMRDANAVLGEQKDTTYQDMYDQQIALEMTRGHGLGIAEVLTRQLAPDDKQGPQSPQQLVLAMLSRAPAPPPNPLLDLSGLPAPAIVDMAPAAALLPEPAFAARSDFRPADRAEFVRGIWPHAVSAARELGVDPRAIVAQAALETGWGSRQIRDAAGHSGNNLFGIKASRGWQGDRVTVTTLEYVGGVPRPQQAQFRAYPDLASGFADYVNFLRDNPRYRDALRSGGSAEIFADKLQSAGYATDPRYAEKIRGILQHPLLRAAATALKAGDDVPI